MEGKLEGHLQQQQQQKPQQLPPLSKLCGHTQSLLSCHAPASSPHFVASSSEDGSICLFDLRNKGTVQRYQNFGGEAVTSITFSAASGDILYAAAGSSIYCLDTRMGPLSRELHKYNFNVEEINQITLNQKASFLAATDDSGETKVIDIHGDKLYKTLRGAHTNICSAVQFHPQKPWEIITGGLDSKIVKWDFSKGKPLKIIEFGASTASSDQTPGQYCNPPFIHSMATYEDKLSREAWRLLAVARGDGAVDVCNVSLESRQGSQSHGLRSAHHRKSKGDALSPDTGTLQNGQSGETYGLLTSIIGHMTAVSCVTFARFAQSGPLIISGSNDKSIKVWDWNQQAVSLDTKKMSSNGDNPKLSFNHKKKVNWICTTAADAENLFVADTSKYLSVYTIM